MKVYISVDIEGITGTTHWDETKLNHADIKPFIEQMTEEAKAAIEGAIAAGATEVIVKDAHDSGRNLDISKFPKRSKVIRGWTGDPMCMVTGLDESFDAAIFIGYHSAGGSEKNPLAHTLSTKADVKINGQYVSEFIVNTYAAALYNVPVAFVSGDAGLMEEVQALNENILTLAVKEGIGAATININPKSAVKETKRLVEKALKVEKEKYNVRLPETFLVEVVYKDHTLAYRNSFYPGAVFIAHNTVQFETHDFYEVLRILHFLT